VRIVELMLELTTSSCHPDVRVWIDLWPEYGLDSEIELPLARNAQYRWTGYFTVGERPGYFMYRIAVAASVGGTWRLTMRRRGCTRVLLQDEDDLVLNKLWLAGTCDLPE
jgi:hypothetical protein